MSYIKSQKLELVEIDFGSGPEKVYFRGMSLYEMDLVDKAREKGKVDGIVETLIYCARNEEGERKFSEDDRSKILRQFNPDSVLVVVNAINRVGKKAVKKGK